MAYTSLVITSNSNLVNDWIAKGGGVMLPPSPMGCGLNVMSCLGFLNRDELATLINRQARESPNGYMMSGMNQLVMSTNSRLRINQQYISFEQGNRSDQVKQILDYLKSQITGYNGSGQFRFILVKLILDTPSELGHTMIIAYDTNNSQLITFDPQLCCPISRPGRRIDTKIRSFDDFYNYLSKPDSPYKGLSCMTNPVTAGGKRKTRKNKKCSKTKRKNKRCKTKRNNKRGGGDLSSDQKLVDSIADFVNDGDNKQLLEKGLISLNEWYDSSKEIKF